MRRLALWRITSGSWLRPAGSMVTPAATSAQVTAGVIPSPVLSPPDPALVEKWEESAEKAVGAILSAMEQSQRGLVSGLGDPKAVTNTELVRFCYFVGTQNQLQWHCICCVSHA